ncbi:hypothetical protein MTBPR1_180034 [Candidatus Terasakiella magnetica]|uniref:Uncharacterized protein n=1 Tax=Candidatus Terasakiella magnetica TaxID=1867952 RepID=A0A1C3RFU1_9PROT|nr:hypothetical protein MTBPR1_180034 [Candidatus Terasakiella magnetica]
MGKSSKVNIIINGLGQLPEHLKPSQNNEINHLNRLSASQLSQTVTHKCYTSSLSEVPNG